MKLQKLALPVVVIALLAASGVYAASLQTPVDVHAAPAPPAGKLGTQVAPHAPRAHTRAARRARRAYLKHQAQRTRRVRLHNQRQVRAAHVAAARAAARAARTKAAAEAPAKEYFAKIAATRVGAPGTKNIPHDLAAATTQRDQARARYRALSAVQPVPAKLAEYDELKMTAAFSEVAIWSFAVVELQQYTTAGDWPLAARKRFASLQRAAARDARAATRARVHAGY